MKLYLKGHTERYPVEQLQMQLFGDRPTQFVETPFSGEDGAVSSLHDGGFLHAYSGLRFSSCSKTRTTNCNLIP